MTDLNELASRVEAAVKPEVLRFSVCSVPTRKGYSWGAVTSSDETTIRLLCDMWNNRHAIAASLRSRAAMGEG